ncbi:MAG: VanZ family protein [Thiobacillus sp.]
MPRRPSSSTAGSVRAPRTTSMLWMAIAYGALVAYGTVFPLSEWTPPLLGWSNPITLPWPAHASRADIMVNLLAYVPLGLFAALWLRPRLGMVAAVLLASLLGSGLSFVLEVMQSALPSRVPSSLDWAVNSAGALGGALFAALFDPRLPTGRLLLGARHNWFAPGALANLALIVLGLWALTQAGPFVPSLDWGNLKSGLKPLGNTLRHPETFRHVDALGTGLAVMALGLIARLAALRPIAWPFLVFSLTVLLLKIPVVGRQLTLEALAGWTAAMALLTVWPRDTVMRAAGAGAALLTAYTLAQFQPGDTATTYSMNWVPFAGQVGSLSGMLDILETLWPFIALALVARWLTPWRWRRAVWLGGGAAVALLALALEWMQQSIPGRFADVTDVLLALLGWMLPWLLTDTRGRMIATEPALPVRTARWALPALAAAMTSLGVAGWTVGSSVQFATDERGRAMLPAPQQLAPIYLPGFRQQHPRLPHPSLADIARLRAENPEWLNQMRYHARNGDLYAITLLARIEPGSQDLAQLHARLLQQQYSYRGEQAKPVALAYDWLYDQWTEIQRVQLRDKLAEGVTYLVDFIRRDRLSPYNVYLYNSPFQALMAANIALYGDDPRGELNMRFTYDLWKHRVLPVWRQVMGQQGGWHEGGEYVGIGIGQAVYQVPAMWRAATGEDLFKSEPGIRGFLDFIVYRKQPDGTDFRWGDASYFDKIVPDLNALALEYRHAAAYSLRPPRPEPAPTSWPWGPLGDTSLIDPNARARLPLAKRFDGIGLVVARSDWSADATYVSFKAGDNYWSHSHLDQGAFTLHKRGGLALDSGLYGPRYGSDHHMNYTYQSIAHNLVTVTDPADTARSDGKFARSIANDGGQRRIGSGWGLASAPIDLTDWMDQRTLYHTGRIAGYAEAADHVVAVADVTPAYTNKQSGSGEFSHRTRRVERLWRSFVYDRAADIVIIFDVVDATQPEFEKRWLLHSTGKPHIAGTRFSVDTGKPDGGHLHGQVLLPRAPRLTAIGGPGFEFWVDGKNYDEAGTLANLLARRNQPVEPGNWRIELMPGTHQKRDTFLVALAPRLRKGDAVPRLELLQQGGRVGVEIGLPEGPRRWWFNPDNGEVVLGDTPVAPASLHRASARWLPEWALSLWRHWTRP